MPNTRFDHYLTHAEIARRLEALERDRGQPEQIEAWAGAIAETAGFITDSMDQAIPPIQNDVQQEIDQKVGAINGFATDIVTALTTGITAGDDNVAQARELIQATLDYVGEHSLDFLQDDWEQIAERLREVLGLLSDGEDSKGTYIHECRTQN